MQAGKLRQRITIVSQPIASNRNEFGEEIAQEQLVANLWADIEPIRGREVLAGNELTAEMSHRIHTRYVRGIEPTHIVKYGARQFNILSVIDVGERHKELEMLAQEIR